MTIDGWLREGTAHRTSVRKEPVIHLLVEYSGDLHMWCSGGKGREDSPYGDRLCRACRSLARDAVADGTLEAASAGRWASEVTP